MPRELLVNLDDLDLDAVEYDIEAIRECNEQRYEMEQLSGIVKLDTENDCVVGYKDVTDHEFWVRGHIPGNPLMPGVLMIEASAQLSSIAYQTLYVDAPNRFIAFGGVDKVKFRGTVGPEDRLDIIVKAIEMRRRRAIFDAQGVCNGKLVFEGVITGMPM